MPCGLGTYKPALGTHRCDVCESGKYASQIGATSCQACADRNCGVGRQLEGCGATFSGNCVECRCSSGTFKADDCDSDGVLCNACGCKACSAPTCQAGYYAQNCTSVRDTVCQVMHARRLSARSRCSSCVVCAIDMRELSTLSSHRCARPAESARR